MEAERQVDSTDAVADQDETDSIAMVSPEHTSSYFRSYLARSRTGLARSIAATVWAPGTDSAAPIEELIEHIDRYDLVNFVVDSAPWDDYYIAYACRPAMHKLRTEWFARIAFDEESLEQNAIGFLRFCRRQGLSWPTRREDARAYRDEITRAIFYVASWQESVVRGLIGPAVDDLQFEGGATAEDDGIPF